ncbi:MAG: PDZ domain-containing protein [Chitinivibrionales bacterium]|nr:PDZ domain-containing protein [Chitinivibrionales bacterium]MBD3355687.1 PDZ domain-containing protein [Chitinivibrionales bacterium]
MTKYRVTGPKLTTTIANIFFAFAVAVLFSRCAFQQSDRLQRQGDANYMFSVRFLYRYFIFQDRLPDDPLSFISPGKLYQSVQEPYTMYLSPNVARAVLAGLETRMTALGVILTPGQTGQIVSDVHPSSPADKSGLAVGDTIISIDDVTLTNLPVERLARLLRGNVGTERDIVIGRITGRIEKTISLSSFLAPSVFVDSLTEAIAYIYISSFLSTSEGLKGTQREFAEALRASAWSSSLILDLRGNGGGELTQSVGVARELLSRGESIIRIVERVYDTSANVSFTRDTTYRASRDGIAKDREIVVLMNESTASGAELVIAALRDNRPDLVLVGGTTLGKARAQVLSITPNTSLARVTNAILLPTRGKPYDRAGIVPTVPISDRANTLRIATLLAQAGQQNTYPPAPASLRRIALIRMLYGPGLQAPLALYHKICLRTPE